MLLFRLQTSSIIASSYAFGIFLPLISLDLIFPRWKQGCSREYGGHLSSAYTALWYLVFPFPAGAVSVSRLAVTKVVRTTLSNEKHSLHRSAAVPQAGQERPVKRRTGRCTWPR